MLFRRLALCIGALGATALLTGCGQGGSPIASSLSGADQQINFGDLSIRAATTNPPIATNGNGSSVFGLTGQITNMEVRNYSRDLAATKVLFTSRRDAGDYEIYSMNPDGSEQTRLTNSPGVDDGACWSPDGTRIAFSSMRDGNFEIYVMNADGRYPTRLTNNVGQDVNPNWSPDGTKIAFNSTRDAGSSNEIYVMNSDGTNVVRLTNNSANDIQPVWSPDGSKIAFTSDLNTDYEIYVMNADGSNTVRLTNSTGSDVQPQWSPDGTKIVFRSFRNLTNAQVYVMTATGSNQTNLSNNSYEEQFPSWSPDGTKIAFLSLRDGNFEVYTMSSDGAGQTRITTTLLDENAARWSPFLQRVRLVGSGGRLGTTATGFLYGSAGQKPQSIVAWDNSDFTQLQLKTLTGQNTTSDLLLFTVEGATNAVAFTSLKFWNFNTPSVASALTISPLNGAVIGIGAYDGMVKTIVPYTAPNRSTGRPAVKVENGRLVLSGSFTGVWDGLGKNVAPQGAQSLTLDAKTGQVLRVGQ